MCLILVMIWTLIGLSESRVILSGSRPRTVVGLVPRDNLSEQSFIQELSDKAISEIFISEIYQVNLLGETGLIGREGKTANAQPFLTVKIVRGSPGVLVAVTGGLSQNTEETVAPAQGIADVLTRMMKQVNDETREGEGPRVWETRFLLDIRHLMVREDGSFRLTQKLVNLPELPIISRTVSDSEVVKFLYDLITGVVNGEAIPIKTRITDTNQLQLTENREDSIKLEDEIAESNLKTNDSAESLKFWQISDIHLDYRYDPNGNPAWPNWCHNDSNPNTTSGMFGNYSCDGSQLVMKSAIDAMRVANPKPEFILWTGDSAPHWHDPTDPDWEYIFKVEKDIVSQLKNNFPDTLILPALGNHDSFPADFFPDHNHTFYQTFMSQSNWTTLLPSQSAQDQFGKCGFYRHDHRPYTDLNVTLVFLVLNTNLYYKAGHLASTDPCGQLQWLDDQLGSATSTATNRVMIVAHVPPGFFERDPSFGVYMKDQNGDDGLNDRYVDIVNKYNNTDTIVAHIYGHTHTDSFRIFRNGTASSVAFVASSVTPAVTQKLASNPSVRLYTYANLTETHLDNYQQFYMDLAQANSAGEITWEMLYDFQNAYNVTDLSVKSVDAVLQSFKASDESLQTFLKLNTVNKVNDPCDAACQNNLICALDSMKQSVMDSCLKNLVNQG